MGPLPSAHDASSRDGLEMQNIEKEPCILNIRHGKIIIYDICHVMSKLRYVGTTATNEIALEHTQVKSI
jgi:hypothetical protein